jgi:hypothetical protein
VGRALREDRSQCSALALVINSSSGRFALPPASFRVAVMGIVPLVIVVAVGLVAIEQFEIDLVQNDSQEIIVDAAGGIESVLRDADLGFAPFYDEHVGVKEMGG